MADEAKVPLTGLFRDSPETSEGKCLVKRRDGTVPEWPWFVLGAKDPVAIVALRAYANEVYRLLTWNPTEAVALGLTYDFAKAILHQADAWEQYRREHGSGDPSFGRHRKDDPATIAEMRKGQGA